MLQKESPDLEYLLSMISKLTDESSFQKCKANLKKIIRHENSLNRACKRKMVVLMKKKNISHDLISEITGVGVKNIQRMYDMWKDRDSFFDAGRSGRPPKLDEEQRNELAKIISENRTASVPEIKKIWENKPQLSISSRSIQRFRKNLGYQQKNAKQKPILNQKNQLKRLSFARKHLKERWDNHVFIDESDFQLFPNKKRVWLFPKEKSFFHRPRHSPSIKVICGISIDGQVFLRTYRGSVT